MCSRERESQRRADNHEKSCIHRPAGRRGRRQAFLIENGGFEEGIAYPNGLDGNTGGIPNPWVMTSWSPDTHDKTGVDGWDDDTGIDFGDGVGIFQNMPTIFGNRFVGIAAGNFGVEAFGQTVSGMRIGDRITVSAWMQTDDRGRGGIAGGPFSGLGTIDVYVDSVRVGSFNPNSRGGIWEQRSLSFVAETESAFISFVANYDPTTGEAAFMGIDEIQAVPEPATLAALGVGLGLLARRRRR
jgi:hypothetical protein